MMSVGERIAEKLRDEGIIAVGDWIGAEPTTKTIAAIIDQELLAAQKISGSETPTAPGLPRNETGHDNYEDTKPYCCRYFHNGGWWGVDIHAFDDEDAAARVAKLGNLQLLGELKMEIPANRASGIFVRLLCTIRNLFYAPKM